MVPSPVDAFLAAQPAEFQPTWMALRTLVNRHLPAGFEEGVAYGMLGWAVPHARYPAGYHCDPKSPLPFAGLAVRRTGISLYHMGVYADPALLAWFQQAHAAASPRKLDMGKSCIRYKKLADVPLGVVGELFAKTSVDAWIACYEATMKPAKR